MLWLTSKVNPTPKGDHFLESSSGAKMSEKYTAFKLWTEI